MSGLGLVIVFVVVFNEYNRLTVLPVFDVAALVSANDLHPNLQLVRSCTRNSPWLDRSLSAMVQTKATRSRNVEALLPHGE